MLGRRMDDGGVNARNRASRVFWRIRRIIGGERGE